MIHFIHIENRAIWAAHDEHDGELGKGGRVGCCKCVSLWLRKFSEIC